MAYETRLHIPVSHSQHILAEQIGVLESYDMAPIARSDNSVTYATDYGHFTATSCNMGARAGIDVRVSGHTENGMLVLQEFIASFLEKLPADVQAQCTWVQNQAENNKTEPSPPNNFQEARVIKSFAVGAGMQRVIFSIPNWQPFLDEGLHVRLLIPQPYPEDPHTPIQWPVTTPSGRLKFPEGAQTLVQRVYTIRHVWPEKGQVDIDFVRHAGGIAATWAERARPGDRIGFIGPVGGQSPVADWMLLGGDETAIPAIGRILENLPDTTIGHVRIHVPTLERTLPLKAPAQMQLEWVIGENGDALVDAMQAIDVPVTPAGTAFVWFAAEQSMATLYRKYLKHTLKMPAQAYTCAGYWQRKQ